MLSCGISGAAASWVPYALIVLIISLTVLATATAARCAVACNEPQRRSAHWVLRCVPQASVSSPSPSAPPPSPSSIHSISTSQRRHYEHHPLRSSSSRKAGSLVTKLNWTEPSPAIFSWAGPTAFRRAEKAKSSKKTNLINACAIFLLL